MKQIARGSGRSAIAAAAYRSSSKIEDLRNGLVHDFSRKGGVEHSEIVLPKGIDASWMTDRSCLWNAAEQAEKRKDARVAREFEVALPHELNAEQRLVLTRTFAQELSDRYGVAVDFAIHAPTSESDIRNVHAHLLMTTRRITDEGLTEKTRFERENKWLLSNNLPTTRMQLIDARRLWERCANEQLALAGFDIRIDHRSHADLGLEIEPTRHVGVHATQLERRGEAISRSRHDKESIRYNTELLKEKPEQVLSLISYEKSVFDRHDIARTLHRYIDDMGEFQNAFAAVMQSKALVELQPEINGNLAKYSTRELVALERAMVENVTQLRNETGFSVRGSFVDKALFRQDEAIRSNGGTGLSAEQRGAVRSITGSERIAAVIGYAGAGKSTMLAAARDAWEQQGYRVRGAALAGKAAEGLEESSGITSRTLASFEQGWRNGFDLLSKNDILVIDEAGMMGSRQLAWFVEEAHAKGAKLVLVGDYEQLQAIEAGAPFRAVVERIGCSELTEVRRQRQDWQKEASITFASHRTSEGLSAYLQHGAVQFHDTGATTRQQIVHDYVNDMGVYPDKTRIVMAHRRVDVFSLNEDIRASLQEQGSLAKGEAEGEYSYQTRDGERRFTAGDRIVFLENNRDLDVKNGMLGSIVKAEPGHLTVALDGKDRDVRVSMADYAALDWGYATTIHKTQGATVDRSFVLASSTLDRHLTYVAMTRHRDDVSLYAARDEFASKEQLFQSLSRSGAKAVTLDYARQERTRKEEPQVETKQSEQHHAPRLFDGFRASLQRKNEEKTVSSEKEAFVPQIAMDKALEPNASLEHSDPIVSKEFSPRLLDAIDRYTQELERWKLLGEDGRKNVPEIAQRFGKAREHLESVRPGSLKILQGALTYDEEAQKDMHSLKGRERAKSLYEAMEREQIKTADPSVRATRYQEQWAIAEKYYKLSYASSKDQVKAKELMGELAQKIEADPVAKDVLREITKNDYSQLSVLLREKNLEQSVEKNLSQERSRGLSLTLDM